MTIPKLTGWRVMPRFAGQSKSRATDIERQRLPAGSVSRPSSNAGHASENLQRPGRLESRKARRDRERIERAREERLSAARQQLESLIGEHGDASLETWRAERVREIQDIVDSLQPPTLHPERLTGLQVNHTQNANSLAVPEPVAQPNPRQPEASRSSNYPIYDPLVRTGSPTLPDVPPPTYAEYGRDQVASSEDYQNAANAAEGIQDLRGLPPIHRDGLLLQLH